MKQLSAKTIAFIGVFAALHVTLYLISPPILWRNWAIYLAPIEGIILGPWAGFSSALIGSILGRFVRPGDFWMFGIVAEPLAVLSAGFLAKRKWKPVLIIYVGLIVAFFAHPLGRELPLWAIIDILLALALIYPAAKLSKGLFKEKTKLMSLSLILVSFVSVSADALVRVFLLVPAGFYSLIGMTPDLVTPIFIAGAIDSFIEDVLVIFISLVVGVPLLIALRKILDLKNPLS